MFVQWPFPDVLLHDLCPSKKDLSEEQNEFRLELYSTMLQTEIPSQTWPSPEFVTHRTPQTAELVKR
eukprot:6056211-Amphidinium_carterae.1